MVGRPSAAEICQVTNFVGVTKAARSPRHAPSGARDTFPPVVAGHCYFVL
jgi:hypothetical protein